MGSAAKIPQPFEEGLISTRRHPASRFHHGHALVFIILLATLAFYASSGELKSRQLLFGYSGRTQVIPVGASKGVYTRVDEFNWTQVHGYLMLCVVCG